jgi:hypothetical protein
MCVMLTYESDSDNELFKEEEGQCTWNIRFTCIRVTIVAVKKQQVLHIVNACL